MHKNIIQEIYYRLASTSYVKNNTLLSIATLLDCFKKIYFQNATDCAYAISTVSKRIKNIQNNNKETAEKNLRNNFDKSE